MIIAHVQEYIGLPLHHGFFCYRKVRLICVGKDVFICSSDDSSQLSEKKTV